MVAHGPRGGERRRRHALSRVAKDVQCFRRHVAPSDGPFVVLLEEDGADQAFGGDLAGSMGRRGNPYDNAVVESFMKTLKVEGVYPLAFERFADAAEQLP